MDNDNVNAKTVLNTIIGTYERCREENIGMKKSQIRYLCVNGIIPYVKIGSKYLINRNVFTDYINGKGFVPNKEEPIKEMQALEMRAKSRRIRPFC